jgi:hypothetical protein
VDDRGNSGVPGERECKRKKKNIGRRRKKTCTEWKERKKGAECAIRREKQLSTCGMERKERREILKKMEER